jgi:lysophospholipase L1-like esterase
LVVLGVCLGLATTEIVLRFTRVADAHHFPSSRITDGRFTNRTGQVSDDNGVRYRFDADGFRASGTATLPGSRTILFIGDSFTEGMGVDSDETFPAVTCDRLMERGVRARCLNGGVSGFGTAHELRLLRALLARKALTVDAVVFQVLPNNDLRDNWEDAGFGLEAGRLAVWDPPHIPLEVRLRDALVDNTWARGSRIVTLAANAWFNGAGMDPHYDGAAFELERQLLQAVVAATRARGVQVVIAMCATAWELDRKKVEPYDERARLDFVADTVRELQVPWVDSRDVASEAEHYIPNDGHFSAAGNAVMGRALAERLAPLLRE